MGDEMAGGKRNKNSATEERYNQTKKTGYWWRRGTVLERDGR